MHHVIPILCIIAFIIVIELQLKKQLDLLREEFDDLKAKINKNKTNIELNSKKIEKNRTAIETNSGKIKELNHDSQTTN